MTEYGHDPFPVDMDEFHKGNYNIYYCKECCSAGKKHKIVEVPTGHTDSKSQWGAGVPTHTMQCTVVKRLMETGFRLMMLVVDTR